jgi:replicative DNA helicase
MEERISPHSDDAERSVLGAAIQNKNALYDVMESLNEGDFYRAENGEIFSAMNELYRGGNSVDLVTVAEILKKRKHLDAVGGLSYLGSLAGVVPSPSNAMQYGKIIREKSILRRLIEKSGEIITECYDDRGDAADVLEKAERNILEIGRHGQHSDYVGLDIALNEVTAQMEKMKDHAGGLTGLTTGLHLLDKYTSGFQPSDLIILAARPGMGKTSLALNIAMSAAERADATVLIFSLEMDRSQLAQRLLSAEARVSLNKIRNGSVYSNQDEVRSVQDAVNRLKELKIRIDSTTGTSINEIKNKCRRLRQKEGLDLVVVDYLQLMDMGGVTKADARPENRQQEIATISRMLKQLAREMECPVLVLSQLSRAVESRGVHKPVLSDLRESGAIEQDADLVLFIYKEKKEDEENEQDNRRQLLIAKHRNGETGEFPVAWIGRYTKFGDAAFGDEDAYTIEEVGAGYDEEKPF